MKKIFTSLQYSKRVVVVCLAIMFCLMIKPNASLGQTAAQYIFSSSAGTYSAIAGTTVTVSKTETGSGSSATTDEGFFNGIPIGFNFNFAGTIYTHVHLNTNGWFTLGTSAANNTIAANSATYYINSFAGIFYAPTIAPLWDDLEITTNNSDISYTTIGSAPNRIFTIQYNNIQWNFNASSGIAFQVKLYETSNQIDFVYKQLAGSVNSGSASIGIASANGVYLSLNGSGVSPTASSTTNTITISTKPANNQIYTFKPPIPIITGLIGSPQCAGGNITINGTNLSGATAATVTIGGTPVSSITSNNGSTIVAVIGAGTTGTVSVTTAGGTATSTANFAVTPAPSITTQPQPQNVCAGNPVTFSVAANNANSYQWQKNGANITGATGSSYNIASVATADAGNYSVIITGASPCGTITSNSVVLTVNTPAVITANPSTQTVCSNTGASFSANASGTSVSFQWQMSTNGGGTWVNLTNTGVYTGVTTTTLNISNAAGLNSNQYRLVATASSPCSNSANSTAATLNVTPAPSITTQPQPQNVCAGNPVTFSVAANNANSYQWQKNGANITGATGSSYNIASVATADAGNYSVIITGASPCGTVTSNSVALTVNTPPSIATSGQPQSSAICAGSSTSFTVTASGTTPTYQWQSSPTGTTWTNTQSDATGYTYSGNNAASISVTTPGSFSNSTYQYRCIVSVATCSSIISNAATLTISGQPQSNAGLDQSVACGTLTTTLVGNQPLSTGGGMWTYAPGSPTAGGIIANPTQYNTTFTGTPAATYTLRWTVSNGTCSPVFDEVNVTFNYGLSGLYSVGATSITGEQGHFITLTRAVENYNTCLNGNVIFALTNNSGVPYTVGEVFPITIDNPTASSTKTLTIKPNTGVTALITGVSTSAIFKLNGSDYVTIDGSNNGSTSQNLTITNSYVDNDADGNGFIEDAAIWIASKSGSDGATNNTIKNCKINGSGASTTFSGIASADNTSVNNTTDAPNSNNTIQNCTVTKALAGINIYGLNINRDLNWLITSNNLSNLYSTGIYFESSNGFTISNNSISNITAAGLFDFNTSGIEVGANASTFTISGNTILNISSGSIFGLYTSGIQVEGNTQTFTISNNTISSILSSSLFGLNTDGIQIFGGTAQTFSVNTNSISNVSGSLISPGIGIEINGTISGTNSVFLNKINNIYNTNTIFGAYGAEGIYSNATTSSATISIYNNFISNVYAYGDNSGTGYNDNGYGIMIDKGSGYKIYYNSINLFTNQNTGITAAINIGSGVNTANSIDLRNNIFANNQTAGASASNRYSIYSTAAKTVFNAATFDYNNYWTNGNTANLGRIANASVAWGTNGTTFQTAFGGNTHSINMQPVFLSSIDLHLDPASNSALDNAAAPITGITTDIDAQTRNPVTPDIGADEFNSCSPALVSWLGGADNNWSNGANWCAGVAPTISQNVIIPAGTTFSPLISLADANALSLTIASGATLTMSSTFNLNLGGGSVFTNNGTFDATASTTGAVVFAGNGTVAGTISFKNVTINGAVDFGVATSTVNGNLTINAGGSVSGASNHVVVYGASSLLIYNTGTGITVGNEWTKYLSPGVAGAGLPNNVIIQNNGTVSIANTNIGSWSTDRSIAGSLTVNLGSSLNLSSNFDLYVAGSWSNNGNFNANGRTVTLNAISATPFTQTISGTTTFYNLTFGNSNITTDFGSSNTTVANQFNNNTGSMLAGSSTVTLTGNLPGTIIGGAAKNFYNLQINSGANINHTTAGGYIHVANTFINNGNLLENAGYNFYFDKSSATEYFTGTGTTTFGNLTIGDGSGLSFATTVNASANFTITGGSMSFYHSSFYNGNNNIATFSTTAATITGPGTANFYDAITNVALNLGSGISTINHNLQINTGGMIITNAPVYGTAATLIYNTINPTYNTSIEWTNNTNSTGNGAPYNVAVTNTNSVVINNSRTVPGTLNLTAGSLDIGTNHTLTVNSGFTGTGGNLKGSTTSNLIAGGAGIINFNPVANYLKDLTINNSANLALGNALNITASNGAINSFGSVTVGSGASATLDATGNGYLNLKSDVYGDAIVKQSSGTISGNVTIERYIPKTQRAWRFLSMPFNATSTQTLNQAWQEGALPYPNADNSGYVNNTIYNPKPGYGTEITFDNYTGNGFDVNVTYNPSLKIWDYSTKTWSIYAPHTNTTKIIDYPAYSLFVRGDRSVNLIQGTGAPVTATTLRATGKLNENGASISSPSVTLANNDFLFVGNPFASPVDFSLLQKNNVNPNYFYVWDPKIGGTGNGVGAYVAYSFVNPVGWSITTGGSYTAVTPPVLQSGQAFFVQSTGGSGYVTFPQNSKNINEFSTSKQQPKPAVFAQLVLPNDSMKLTDGITAVFGDNFSTGRDEFDVPKMWNIKESMALQRGADFFVMEARPLLKLTDTIFVKLYLYKDTAYALKIFSINMPNLRAWLVDKYLNTKTEINLTDTALYNFTPNIDTNSYRNRFMLVFNRQLQTTPVPVTKVTNQADPNITGIANNNLANNVTIAPNPVTIAKNALLRFNNIAKGLYEITMYNAKGQKLGTEKIQHDGSNTTYHLPSNVSWPAGVYSVVVIDQITKQSTTLKLIVSQ